MAGTLFVVATPIGNLDDITSRALRTLREVALIAAEDTRRTAHLLSRYAIQTPTMSLHAHNEGQRTGALVARLERGDSIALVSDAGMPTIADPGQRLIKAAIAAGVRVEPIPGPSAVIAALAVSGFPADSFTFLGFPPTRAKDRNAWLDAVRLAARTVVFFEAPHRIEATLADMLRTVGDCDVCVTRELTKTHEELVRGPISHVLSALGQPRGEFTVVANIGQLTEHEATTAPTDEALFLEFGVLTKIDKTTRRAAVASLARKYAIPAGEIYKAIERGKSSIE